MPKKQTRREIEARQGRPVVKRGVRGIYEVLWYDTGAGEVRSLVNRNRTIVAKYTPGLGWVDRGRLPYDVREYAQQIASSESTGRSGPESKKSHTQIKREVDEILTGIDTQIGQVGLHGLTEGQISERHRTFLKEMRSRGGTISVLEMSRVIGEDPKTTVTTFRRMERDGLVIGDPEGNTWHLLTPIHRRKDPIPGISAWNMFAGGLSAAPGKHSYSLNVPEGEYHVNPISSPRGRHRGYSLRFSARQPPRGGHGGLWHDLGMHRSPAQAAVAARKHYVASY